MDWALHPQLAADTVAVARWPLCDLLLMDDDHWPWLILVPRVAGARELFDLDPAAAARRDGEVRRAARGLQAATSAHKINVAALGNVVEQLHVHVIARQLGDPGWPRPVWGAAERRRYPAGEAERLAQVFAAALG